MESQPQHPEFRNNPENFHPWVYVCSKGSGVSAHIQLVPKSHALAHMTIQNFRMTGAADYLNGMFLSQLS